MPPSGRKILYTYTHIDLHNIQTDAYILQVLFLIILAMSQVENSKE